MYFQSICKINNFSNVSSTCRKYYRQLSCAKNKVVEKFCFNELQIEKAKFFTHSPTKIFCINVLKVGLSPSKIIFLICFNDSPSK